MPDRNACKERPLWRCNLFVFKMRWRKKCHYWCLPKLGKFKSSMVKATQQDVGSLAQTCKPQIQVFSDFWFGMIDTILHPTFHIAMAIFFWIEFWRIRRQILSMNFRMLGQISLDQVRSMRSASDPRSEWMVYSYADGYVPNQPAVSPHWSSHQNVVCKSCHWSSKLPWSMSLDDISWSVWFVAFGLRCPGKADRFRIRKSKLIFKNDLCAEMLRFFLSRPILTQPGLD